MIENRKDGVTIYRDPVDPRKDVPKDAYIALLEKQNRELKEALGRMIQGTEELIALVKEKLSVK